MYRSESQSKGSDARISAIMAENLGGRRGMNAVHARRSETGRLDRFRWTPGLGLRIASPVGPIRFDLAYNNYPQEQGPAYVYVYDPNTGNPSRLRCVSPGNTLPNGFGEECPATFSPRRDESFFEKLTFHFSIGQAF